MAKTFADYENQAQAKVFSTMEDLLDKLPRTAAVDLEAAFDKLRDQWEAVQEVVDEVVDAAFDAGKGEGAAEAHG